jgi:hypothetical protein
VAISIVGGATGTTSATLPTHQAGDVIIAFAFRDGSTTQPTLPAGWIPITNVAGTLCCSRTAWRRATGAGTTTGTWTNASRVSFIVLRGCWSENPIAADATGSGSGTNLNYPAVTLRKTNSTSMGVRFAGDVNINTTLETPPTNWTNLAAASGVDAVAECACHTRASLAANIGADTVAKGGTSGAWTAHSIEVFADPPAGNVENYITEASNAGNTVSGAIPTGWEFAGTLTITGVGTESGRQYTEYRWQYTNSTGAEDFPGINLASGTVTQPTVQHGNIFVLPSDVIVWSCGIKRVAGSNPPTPTIAAACFLANGNYVGETSSTSIAGVGTGAISDFVMTGTVPATSVEICPSISADVPTAGTIDFTFRLYEPQFEFGTTRGSVFVPTTVGPDYAAGGVNASLAWTEPMDTFAATASIENKAQLAWTEPMDTFAGSATIANQAQLAWTEPMDAFAGAATIANQVQLAWTEPMDAFAGTVSLGVMAQLAWTEPMDTFAAQANMAVMATLAWTEPMDTLAANVSLALLAQLSYTEPMDTFAGAASVRNLAQLAYTEPMDVFTASVTITDAVTAALAWTEPMDTVSMTVSLGVVAALAYTEPMDTFAADVTISDTVIVTMAYVEPMDLVSMTGWLYPWHDNVGPQTNPWLPGSVLGGTWTDKPAPLSSVWGAGAGPDDNPWTDKPDPTTVWE